MNDMTSRFMPDKGVLNYEEFPFYWLTRVYRVYILALEHELKKLGTDVPTRRVLLMLRLHGSANMSQLAAHTVIKLSTVTRIVQRMREAGLIQTRPNPEDARITDVSMTAEGEALTDRIMAATEKIYLKAFQNLSAQQLSELNETLRVMSRNFTED